MCCQHMPGVQPPPSSLSAQPNTLRKRCIWINTIRLKGQVSSPSQLSEANDIRRIEYPVGLEEERETSMGLPPRHSGLTLLPCLLCFRQSATNKCSENERISHKPLREWFNFLSRASGHHVIVAEQFD